MTKSYMDLKTYNKPVYQVISIGLRWFFRPLKALWLEANFYQRSYILGSITLFTYFFMYLSCNFPILNSSWFLFFILIFTLKKKNKSFFSKLIKQTYDWFDFSKSIKIFLALIIIVAGEYLVISYYPKPFFIQISNNFGWLNLFLCISISIFVLGLITELIFLWNIVNEKVNSFVPISNKIVAALSFISIYFARLIIIHYSLIEPAPLSRALIVLSISTGLISWLIICLIFFTLISLFSIIFNYINSFVNMTIDIYEIHKQSWFKFLFRKKEKIKDTFWLRSIFYEGGRAMGAGTIALILSSLVFSVFSSVISHPIETSNLIENVIINLDYRHSNKISECTNLAENEWGLLVGTQKISVAKPNVLGGYSFETRKCVF